MVSRRSHASTTDAVKSSSTALTAPCAAADSSSPPDEGASSATPAPKCTCLGGWMSPSMRWVLELYITVQLDSVDWQVEDVDLSYIQDRPVGILGISCIPDDLYPSTSERDLQAFLWGYVYVLNVILKVLQSDRLPTPDAVRQELDRHRIEDKGDPSVLPLPATRAKASHYLAYARCGGTVEHALESILSYVADLIHDEQYEFLSTFAEEPPEGEWTKQGKCETGEHGVFGDKHWRRIFTELLGEGRELQDWCERGWEEDEELEESMRQGLAGTYSEDAEDDAEMWETREIREGE
ncbi:hypothetical protein JCM6882_004724 [Rhodosporidiobolus microsporus]